GKDIADQKVDARGMAPVIRRCLSGQVHNENVPIPRRSRGPTNDSQCPLAVTIRSLGQAAAKDVERGACPARTDTQLMNMFRISVRVLKNQPQVVAPYFEASR